MKKPQPKTREPVLDFNECTEYIEKKHHIQTRDYANSSAQFGEWCDAKGYGKTDPEGNDRGSSQIWFAQFQADIVAGLVVDKPYQDFWHWLIDVVDIRNGGTIELSEELGEGAEPWQKRILGLYLSEFGKGPYVTEW